MNEMRKLCIYLEIKGLQAKRIGKQRHKITTVLDIFVDLQTGQRITTEWEKHKGRKTGQRGKEGKKVHINFYGLF